VDRLACVNVAALPLQILLRAHPAWTSLPVVVTEEDRPQALVLYLNARARRAGVRIGQRYATALALARALQAGTVSQSQIENTVRAMADRLRRYSPHVEPASDKPGVFWLDVQGLSSLYSSLHTWAHKVRAGLRDVSMNATVAVGFSRFGVYALTASHQGTVVCGDASEEHKRVQRVSLTRLDLDPDVRNRLLTLGVRTVGDFLRLPSDGIRVRFGAATDALYQLAAGHRWAPLVPVPAEEAHQRSVDFDTPESQVERLVFVIKRLLDRLVVSLTHQAQTIVEIALKMKLDDRTTRVERIRPAAPTLDVAQLLALVYLRLETLRFSAGIVTLRVTAETCPATSDQHRLFLERTRRDAESVNQALARIRAECGEHSVVRARICDAHLPAARFVWEPLTHVAIQLAPRVVAARPLVRRIYTQPLSLALGFKLPGMSLEKKDAEVRTFGPYVMSGGWWGGGVHRDYYFVHTNGGDLWWLYYDHRQQRFFLQGQVE
jgi:protein ImuB